MIEQTSLFAESDIQGRFENRPTGESLKEEGITRVLDNASTRIPEWKEQVISCLSEMSGLITSEDLRSHASAMGIPEPHHHNAWGAVMNAAAKRGLIESTGTYTKSTRGEAHARVLQVWRVN